MNSEAYWRYWGEADPNYAGEPKWHPLASHCLDVAAARAARMGIVPTGGNARKIQAPDPSSMPASRNTG